MPRFSTVKTAEDRLALIGPLLVCGVLLLGSVNVHVDNLVIHSMGGVGGVIVRGGLEVKMIKEVEVELVRIAF